MPLYHAGQILFYQGRHDEAERYLARAVAGYFSPLIIKEEEIWHDYALILWFAQKVNASVKNFENALTINPMFTKACGRVLDRGGQAFRPAALESQVVGIIGGVGAPAVKA